MEAGADRAGGAPPLGPALALAAAAGALAFAMQTGRSALGPVGAALAVWLVAGALTDLWLRGGRGGLSDKALRLTRLPRADWGKLLAHSGLGITIFGVAAMTAWQVEDIRVAKVGETLRGCGLSDHAERGDPLRGAELSDHDGRYVGVPGRR